MCETKRGIRCLCAVTGLQSHRDYRDLVGKLTRDWSTAVDGYGLLGQDKPGWQGAGVALYATVQYECTELCLGTDDEPVKSL